MSGVLDRAAAVMSGKPKIEGDTAEALKPDDAPSA